MDVEVLSLWGCMPAEAWGGSEAYRQSAPDVMIPLDLEVQGSSRGSGFASGAWHGWFRDLGVEGLGQFRAQG